MDYCNDFLQKLADDSDDGHDTLSNFRHLLPQTTSSAFSGIAADVISDNWTAATLSRRLGSSVTPPRCMFMIEIDDAEGKRGGCGTELQAYSEQDPQMCRFGNIEDFWRPEVRPLVNRLKQKPHLALEVLGPLLLQNKAVKLRAHCYTHNKTCMLRYAEQHRAGNMCTPYSKQGSQLGFSDPLILTLLCWNLLLGLGAVFILFGALMDC